MAVLSDKVTAVFAVMTFFIVIVATQGKLAYEHLIFKSELDVLNSVSETIDYAKSNTSNGHYR